MAIFGYNVCDGTNVGDQYTSPFLYLRTNAIIEDVRMRRPVSTLQAGDVVVFGGGGMISECWDGKLDEYVRKPRKHRVAIWGAGHNHPVSGHVWDPAWMADADLVMVRDWPTSHVWAPCPSCLLPPLAELAITRPLHDYVVYHHEHIKVPYTAGSPQTVNNGELMPTLRFLASGRTVVTTSYHGAYWAILMGREAICYPSSTKFTSMRHPARLVALEKDWHGLRGYRHPGALEECRDATVSAWHRLKELG